MYNNTTLSLIITNNLGNKIYIPKDTTIDAPEEISSDHYKINEITLTATGIIKIDNTNNAKLNVKLNVNAHKRTAIPTPT